MAKISKANLFEEQNKLTRQIFKTIESYSDNVKKIEEDALKKIKKAKTIAGIDIILTECKSDVQKITADHRKNLKELNEAVTKNMKKIDNHD